MKLSHIELEGYRARNVALRHLTPTLCGMWTTDSLADPARADCEKCRAIEDGHEGLVIPDAAEPVVKHRPASERLEYYWWCEEHEDIHLGDLSMWTMEHRESLHPVYVHWRPAVATAG
jgi:hypothetical protein